MKYQGKEFDFQITCMTYLKRYRQDLFAIHVPNEGISIKIPQKALAYGKKRKAMGVVAGCPDILIFNQTNTGNAGLAIELKVEGGRVNEMQKEFAVKLQKLGWVTTVCWSVDEFLTTIEHHYKLVP